MSHLPFHVEQLEFIKELASSRIEWLNPFFRLLHFFDTPNFYYALVPIILIGFSYRMGIRFLYWFTFNSIINSFFKILLAFPRPTFDLPEVGMYQLKSFGAPSGGAQISVFLMGLFLYYNPGIRNTIFAVSYVLLISFSRLYLGVHYPIDILIGWILGFLVLLLFINFHKPIEKTILKLDLTSRLFLMMGIPLSILILFPKSDLILGSILGAGIGIFISLKYKLFLEDAVTYFDAFARSCFAIIFLFGFQTIYPNKMSTLIHIFITALMITSLISPIIKKLKVLKI